MNTVLIMEDESQLASYWREALEAAGYIVIHASDFAEAVAVLETRDVDVVVSDMLIRDEDDRPSSTGGLSLMTHLRLHVRPVPKIVAVSGAHPDLHILRHAELLHAAACIVKPFSAEELIETIGDLLASESSS